MKRCREGIRNEGKTEASNGKKAALSGKENRNPKTEAELLRRTKTQTTRKVKHRRTKITKEPERE